MKEVTAYIDPGTGSLLLQAILGGVAAAAVAVKLYWRRLRSLLRFRPPVGDRSPR